MKFIKKFIPTILVIAIIGCADNKNNKDKVQGAESQSMVAPVPVAVDTSNILIAQVSIEGKYGYINPDFKLIIDPQFDNAMRFNEGLACVKVGEKWGFINIRGEFVIKPSFDDPGIFYEGLAKVGNMVGNGNGSRKYFYINKAGQNPFNTEFKFAKDFNNGIAEVKDLNYKTLFIDISGKAVQTGPPLLFDHFKYPKKPYGGELTKSLVLDPRTGNPIDVKIQKSKFGYTNEFGSKATEAIYADAREFHYSYKTPLKYYSTNEKDTIKTIISAEHESTNSNSTLTIIATYNKAMLAGGEWSGLIFVDNNEKEYRFLEKDSEDKIIKEFWSQKVTDTEVEESLEVIHTVKSNQGKKFKIIFTTKQVQYQGYAVDDAHTENENVIISFEPVP